MVSFSTDRAASVSTRIREQAQRRLQERVLCATRRISCEYNDGVILLRGRLTSFYQKQLAQEALRNLDGVKRIVNDIEVIQLKAQGRMFPRVVNIWGVGFDDAMYVWSDPGSGWSQRVDQRPDDVRVRVGNNVYALSATKVTDASETERVAAAFQAKYAEAIMELYGEPTTIADFELLYRLTPRR